MNGIKVSSKDTISNKKDETKEFHPFIAYCLEDKLKYPSAKSKGYIDPDDDFLIGNSGGFLMNINFTFVDTYLLREAASEYEKEKSYIDAEIDSPLYDSFRLREEHRRKYGYTASCKKLRDGTIIDLRITGSHYNFLNYGRMKRTDDESITGLTATKSEGFPDFIDAQYWKHKIDEFCKNNGFNFVGGKSRRGGFSYMEGIDSANIINLYKKSVVIHCAFDKKYIVGGEKTLTKMTIDQLQFYEQHTPFFRCGKQEDGTAAGFLRKDDEDILLGYREGGIDKGILSNLVSVSFGQSTDVAIGKDALAIKIEELSNAPNLEAFMNVTDPATTAGDYKTGIIKGWGTAGSKEGSWLEFEKWFSNPGMWNGMKFENVWDRDSRHITCGFFKPFIWGLEGEVKGVKALDKDGNSNLELSLIISNRRRKDYWEKHKNKSKYLGHCAQYANSPNEAFSASVDNIFSSEELNQHIIRVKTDPDLKFYRDGMLHRQDKNIVFIPNERAMVENKVRNIEEQYKVHDYIEEYPLTSATKDVYGCIREWYPPYKVDGVVPKGLYRIELDPFAIDKDRKLITKRDSLCSIRVEVVTNNIIPSLSNVCVATYAGRPEDTEMCSIIAILMSEYYGNAEVLAEVDRGTTVSDFKKHKKMQLLTKEPAIVWDNKIDTNTLRYGMTIGTTDRKLDGLGYVQEDLYEVRKVDEDGSPILGLHYELDLPFLLELQKFNGISNADRLSCKILGSYHRKMLSLLKHEAKLAKTKGAKTIFDDLHNWYGGSGNNFDYNIL